MKYLILNGQYHDLVFDSIEDFLEQAVEDHPEIVYEWHDEIYGETKVAYFQFDTGIVLEALVKTGYVDWQSDIVDGFIDYESDYLYEEIKSSEDKEINWYDWIIKEIEEEG